MDRSQDRPESESIAALKAIIQTMLPELYSMESGGLPKQNFVESLERDEPVAMTISNELADSEIDEAFGWTEMASEREEAELRATPVTPFLNAEQVGKLREQLATTERSQEGSRGCEQDMPDTAGTCTGRRGS